MTMSDDDRKRRTKHAESASDALRRVLEQAGIPTPELLDQALAGQTPSFSEPRTAPARVDRVVRADRLKSLGWPTRAIESAMDADTTRPAIRVIDAWEPSKSAMVLCGVEGCGKTVAAAWWALQSRRVFHFVRAAELVRVGRFAHEWKDWLGAPGLCVDDLGAEYTDAKGSFAADLDLLIDTYYSNRKPLIITTNCDAAALLDRYGKRINDRITEAAVWGWVDASSMRGPGR